MKPEITITKTETGALEILVTIYGEPLDRTTITPIMLEALKAYLADT